MVFKSLCAAALLAAFPAVAETVTQLSFTSQSPDKHYGIYILAPVEGCTFVRYLVTLPGKRAQTHVLRAGQGQMLRLGRGYAPGLHNVQIRTVGCPMEPARVVRVVLRKASPDHGARALTYIKAYALGERKG